MSDDTASGTENLEKKYSENQEIWKCSPCGSSAQRGSSKGAPPLAGCSNGGSHIWKVTRKLDVYGRTIPGYGDGD